MGKNDFWLHNLFRHQTAGFLATLADFGTFNLLTYVVGIYYVTSNVFAAAMGAVVNFILSTTWAFSGSKNSLRNQMAKYVLVSVGSLVLNTLFVYLLTDFGGLFPNLSKVITAIFIASTYNFLLMRHYVFRK